MAQEAGLGSRHHDRGNLGSRVSFTFSRFRLVRRELEACFTCPGILVNGRGLGITSPPSGQI